MNAEIVVPLKYLSNSWRTLDTPLIRCEVSLILTWSENCVLTSKATRNASPEVVAINNPADATFKITDSKLYVLVVALSTQEDNKLLEQSKTGFKRTSSRNNEQNKRL